jgi:hypothetical protein
MHLQDTAPRAHGSSGVIGSGMHPLAMALPSAAEAQVITAGWVHHVTTLPAQAQSLPGNSTGCMTPAALCDWPCTLARSALVQVCGDAADPQASQEAESMLWHLFCLCYAA